MALDESLATRVRGLLARTPGIAEKRMFGGVAFLLNGNMSVGVNGSDLIVRIDPASTEAALCEPGVRVFDMTGRPMKGWILVTNEALADKTALASWVRRGVALAKTLPAK